MKVDNAGLQLPTYHFLDFDKKYDDGDDVDHDDVDHGDDVDHDDVTGNSKNSCN